MRETTEKEFGIPAWDLYSCEICGSVLLAHTVKLHAEFHGNQPAKVAEDKYSQKACPICKEVINIPLDSDGAMILDIYDDHLESH